MGSRRRGIRVALPLAGVCLLAVVGLWALRERFDLRPSTARRSGPPPNLVLISIDTLRADHVSLYGYSRPTTPALDSLGREGVWFENAVSPAPWTLPAHMSAFTGLPPSEHRVETENNRLPSGVSVVTEILRGAGYRTAGFVSHVLVGRSYGFAQGFDLFVEETEECLAAQVTERVLAWLDSSPPEPFFLFVHYFDPHWDYHPPENYARMFGSSLEFQRYGDRTFLTPFSHPWKAMEPEALRHTLALYDGEIRYTDDQIGRLRSRLEQKGLLQRTAIAVFSDHGEEFRERGSFGHGHSFFPEVVGVPLLLRYPERIPAGSKIVTSVSLYDLPATLSALAGVVIPDQFTRSGRNLLELLRDPAGDPERTLVLESTRRGPKRYAGLRRGFKYIMPYRFFPYSGARQFVSVKEGLFEIAKDRAHARNLLGAAGAEASAAREAIDADLAAAVRRAAPALVLDCAAQNGAHTSLSGRIDLGGTAPDEPFGFRLQANDRIEPPGFAAAYEFALTAARTEKLLVFPTGNNPEVRLSLHVGGKTVFEGPLSLRELAGGRRFDAAAACSLRWSALRTGEEAGAANLSASQLEGLRKLGYIQ